MRRFIKFEHDDDPNLLDGNEFDCLLEYLIARNLPVKIGDRLNSALTGLNRFERTEVLQELLHLDDESDNGTILVTLFTEEEANIEIPDDFEYEFGGLPRAINSSGSGGRAETAYRLSPTASGVGNAVAFTLLRGIPEPTPENNILDNYAESVVQKIQVPSTSRGDEGLEHTVSLVHGVPVHCTCEGFNYRGQCKHLKQAVQHSRGR